MSQHRCHTSYNGKPVELLMGWDRPLQYLFFTALSLTDGEDPVAAASPLEGFDSLDELEDSLAEHGIAVPPEMLAQVAHDQEQNAGNLSRWFTFPNV